MRHTTRMTFRHAATATLVALAIAAPIHAEEGAGAITTFEPTEMDLKTFDGPGVTVTSGADIYATICAGCHMPEGQGAVGAGAYPALSGNEKLEYPNYAVHVVVNGQKAMPAFGHLLSNDQVAAVVNYLQSSLGNAYEPAATAEDVQMSRR